MAAIVLEQSPTGRFDEGHALFPEEVVVDLVQKELALAVQRIHGVRLDIRQIAVEGAEETVHQIEIVFHHMVFAKGDGVGISLDLFLEGEVLLSSEVALEDVVVASDFRVIRFLDSGGDVLDRTAERDGRKAVATPETVQVRGFRQILARQIRFHRHDALMILFGFIQEGETLVLLAVRDIRDSRL